MGRIKKVTGDDGKITKVQVWDTAGHDKYRVITKSYYRGSDAMIVCFDVTDVESFNQLSTWLRDVDSQVNVPQIFPKIIVGTKIERTDKRIITEQEARERADQFGLEYFEVSSMTGENVDETFAHIIAAAVDGKRQRKEDKERIRLSNNADDDEDRKRCPCTIM